MPQPHNEELIKTLAAKHGVPQLNEQALKFINSDDVMFSALTLFPWLPAPNQRGLNRDQILMMYMLGLEDKYWPAMMQLSSGLKIINKLRDEFKKQVPRQFSNICNSPNR